ncbi:MAG: sulfur oxidation c-type cytochrome SoxX [gamma proteobacterium symbiont of Ctena orbiculata]|uniref:Sulfur oxidation c-type cytochrome SoxX n=1 Tax=Candidatus Thiodiazotropha taylori TaxID=2792791 RepID=A0A944QRU2_9GAMM|nr:sulfur oxidation c-type cytochrome SoxX [Candidatus Thiodiazotropha taylori]PUB85711.1 MAG: sulfur oxidation c-type cytochrome SoxX [gamma proteobacterium symbiont of Ctena orbiculata]MBT2988143.1 sulfur oxidation c-type cytochrome SoxX [Candidatus Thiodiazotropha taylori]MBT2998507.1 sulfur oxidation c-type cytochrome SoxX [Candidatus Thiodiazotropha taylori]MBT3002115.1 sulfur oxidation c-type cytochrome SoxX [Candidatus Thiodiazotropha taylori]
MIGNTKKWIGVAGTITVLAGQFLISPAIFAAGGNAIEEGKKIAFDRKKGNCLACHNIINAPSPGNIAPALVAMKARYASKEELRMQIWDATIKNPESAMPPFGKHGILSEADLEKVIEYVWTL